MTEIKRDYKVYPILYTYKCNRTFDCRYKTEDSNCTSKEECNEDNRYAGFEAKGQYVDLKG